VKTFGIFLAAALCEIAGCFAFWAWLKNGKPIWLAGTGIVALVAFAWLLTRVDVAYAGRAYAAYGGIYIVASLVWLGLIEGQRPSVTDIAGSLVCLLGAGIILAGAGVFSGGK
jgi:small multidrug resistance family-3 protein